MVKSGPHIALMVLFFWLCAYENNANSQQGPNIEAVRTDKNIQIDGILDEDAWLDASTAEGFTQLTQNPGELASQQTTVRFLYDNKFLYIAALLLDNEPDKILKELRQRDDTGTSDWFGFIVDTYQDGLNGLGFYVTAAGVQMDIKYSGSLNQGGGRSIVYNGDIDWDAVWNSAIQITGEGWMAEMKIPWSALRFKSAETQDWNINFSRQIKRENEISFWSEVKPEVSGLLNQSGTLSNIRSIKTPLRLSATPFLAVSALNDFNPDEDPRSSWGRAFNAGMDIRYGISDAFTLDMTLIPDFGEARSDDEVLNLSPFEVQFDENRQFFKEGTERFNKGSIFYTRRVGGTPVKYYDIEDELQDDEEIIENPGEAQLYNAFKISGKTSNGLGIGFFNGIAAKTVATIQDTITGTKREIETGSLTNYNVMVLDQTLKNNSYVALINTNVVREGHWYDANTTATEFELREKSNTYAVVGSAKLSQQFFTDSISRGHQYSLAMGKISGNYTFSLQYNVESDDYNPNDLGYIQCPNEREVSANVNFNQYEPFGSFIAGGAGLNIEYNRLFSPNHFSDFEINSEGWLRTQKNLSFGAFLGASPFGRDNYHEARTEDFSVYIYNNPTYWVGGWISSDYRKKLALDIRSHYWNRIDDPGHGAFFMFSPRFRFSDRFSLIFRTEYDVELKDPGFAEERDEDIVFGIRDRSSFENLIALSYSINPNLTFDARFRHYLSSAIHEEYYFLNKDDGSLEAIATDPPDADQSLNLFTVDFIVRWRFSPGSDLYFIWKNNIDDFREASETHVDPYFNSLNSLAKQEQSNTFTLKAVYYLDAANFIKNQ